MAETIKGINIVIGAETTGLTAALSEVNKKSKDVQSELRQVDKLLKLDPGNAELLAQKQKLLSDAIANTKEKLEALKNAQEQVNQQFAEGNISEGQYRAFQREIAKTEQELRGLENRFKQTGDSADKLGDRIQAAGDKIGAAGEKMTGIGEKMSAGVTAPIVATGAIMLKGAADAQVAQGKLQASLGLTEAEAKKLGDTAQKVWKDGFGENIDAANAAVISVRHNMKGLAEGELEAVTKGAITVADVFGEDVNEVTKTAGVMMRNFKISGKEALDLITVGFQKGGNFSGELLDTLREYSPQFEALGLTADQFLGVLIEGAEAGAWNLDKVGDAMKEFNIRAQDGSKTTAEGFGLIGLNAAKMGADIAKGGKDAQKAFMATISALAAMEDPLKQNQAGVALFGTQWEDVRSQVVIAMAEGIAGIDDFQGATDSATKAVHDNNPAIALIQALRGLQKAIGPALLPLADIINTTVAPALESMAKWFSSLSPAGQKISVAIAGIAAAIGPLLVIFGTLASAVSGIIGLFGAGAAAGAGGAAAGGGGLAAAITAITGPIGIAVAAIAGLIAIFVALYKNNEDFREGVQKVWQQIQDYFSKAMAFIGGIVKKVLTEVQTLFSDVLGKISAFWQENGDTIMAIVGFFMENIKANIEMVMGIIKGIFEAVWPVITAVINTAWEAIKLVIGTSMDIVLGTIQTTLKILQGDWAGAWETIKETATNIMNNIIEFFKNIDLVQTGKDIIQGLIDGISSMAAAVKEKVEEMAESVKTVIKTVLGISSPSTVMAQYGQYVAEGLAQGMDDNSGKVSSSAGVLASSITAAMTKISDGVSLAASIAKAKFELLVAKMGENSSESDLMKAKLESLNVQMDSHNDKITALTQAYEDMKRIKGETADETQRLYLELIKEQTAQATLANEIARTNKVRQESLTQIPSLPEGASAKAINTYYLIQQLDNAWKAGKDIVVDGGNVSAGDSDRSTNINGPINVNVKADSLKQVSDVVDLFSNLTQSARAT